MRIHQANRGPFLRFLTRLSLPAFSLIAIASATNLAAAQAPAPAAVQTPPPVWQRVVEVARDLEGNPRMKGMTAQQREGLVSYVTGNMLFAIAHEAGHALIAELGIPVLGREEDAADAFAVLTGLGMKNDYADRVVADAAMGWFLSERRNKKEGIKNHFYDEHGMDLQRAYNIVCLMVGSDGEKFEKLADRAKLPKERQGTCQGDYSNASWSWDKALATHLRKPDQPKTAISVTYGPAQEYEYLADVAKRLKILEITADALSNRYVWRGPIGLEMQACGSPGASWDLSTKKIRVCYELAYEFSMIYRKYGEMNADLPVGKKSAKVAADKRRK